MKYIVGLCLLVVGATLAQPALPETQELVPWLVLTVKDYGRIVVELFPDDAPLNVRNVETLAARGFYNGLTFHRIVPGFVIQGGDPTGTGAGGPDYTVPAEIKLKHVRGGFAMARTDNSEKASSSCQFYINLADLPQLDGKYTVIGQVREGMEVVDRIATVARVADDRPKVPVVMSEVTVEMRPRFERRLEVRSYMKIEFQDFGTVRIELFPEDAPKNVANVESLARKGFYDGLTMHRVIPGFVIQGGDPTGTGAGGPNYTVPAEIKRKHVRGAVAMARTGDQVNPEKASSSCQFYICLKDLPFLDEAGYTVIGQVTEGMEVVDRIAQVETGPGDKPVQPVVMTKVTIESER